MKAPDNLKKEYAFGLGVGTVGIYPAKRILGDGDMQ
jgi:hypothetical protein